MSATESIRENLVIGGGLAGTMTGLRLAAAGCEVALLEKERRRHDKVCGEFLSPEAVEYLRQAGVDPVGLGAVGIDRLRLSAKKRFIETRLPFHAYSLSRGVLDAALLARAAEAGCEIRRGATVQRLFRNGDGWTVQVAEGMTAAARNVFLATGKHDLRGWTRQAGRHGDLVGFKMYWRLRAEETYALRGFMDLFLFEGGYGGLSLVENSTANLCLVVRRSRLLRLGSWRELLFALSDENALIAQRLAGAESLWERPLAISSIPYGCISESTPGMWRVGDQAAVIPSFTGDGMAIALHSGALAAEMYLAGKTPNQYSDTLGLQLNKGMQLAMLLSRAMVSFIGLETAPAWLPVLPWAIKWIALSTRIPVSAMQHGSLRPEQVIP
jgi:flavin-dependent dehydrogenase